MKLSLSQFVSRAAAYVAAAAVAVILPSCGGAGSPDDEGARLLRELDRVVASHHEVVAAKDSAIKTLSRHIPDDDEARLDAYDRLYSEYFSFNLDSATRYAQLKIDVVGRLGDPVKQALAYLNLARVAFAAGNESEAMEAMAAAVADTSQREVAMRYYDVMEAYAEMKCRDRLPWLRRLDGLLDRRSSHWVYNRSNLLKAEGDLRGAALMLESRDSLLLSSPHLKALTNYLLGRLSLEQGDTAMAVKRLTASAINDLQTPVRDYKSLYELAALLLKQGDTERAYRYINLAVEDVKSSKVLDNIMSVNEIMPQIVAAHDAEAHKERMRYMWFSAGLLLMTLLLAAALISMRRANRLVKAAADKEKSLNAELHSVNRSLNTANESLVESNRVKDAYLVQYFNLCSHYVGCFEQFRGSVSAAARSKGLPGVEALIAKTDDRELKKFYADFDETFLKLFPGFVEGLNGLLVEENRVALNRDGSMSSELRVMALIRLGIVDSEQIARFLRRSVSTIYNYRVKMRNASVGPREEFESRVRSLPQ